MPSASACGRHTYAAGIWELLPICQTPVAGALLALAAIIPAFFEGLLLNAFYGMGLPDWTSLLSVAIIGVIPVVAAGIAGQGAGRTAGGMALAAVALVAALA